MQLAARKRRLLVHTAALLALSLYAVILLAAPGTASAASKGLQPSCDQESHQVRLQCEPPAEECAECEEEPVEEEPVNEEPVEEPVEEPTEETPTEEPVEEPAEETPSEEPVSETCDGSSIAVPAPGGGTYCVSDACPGLEGVQQSADDCAPQEPGLEGACSGDAIAVPATGGGTYCVSDVCPDLEGVQQSPEACPGAAGGGDVLGESTGPDVEPASVGGGGAVAGEAAAPSGPLPYTGLGLGSLAAIGGALLLSGLTLIGIARRRSSAAASA